MKYKKPHTVQGSESVTEGQQLPSRGQVSVDSLGEVELSEAVQTTH